MSTLRSLAVKSDGQSALDARRLSRELSELASVNAGRDSQTADSAVIEDPTSVVALLNVAGVRCCCFCGASAHSFVGSFRCT